MNRTLVYNKNVLKAILNLHLKTAITSHVLTRHRHCLPEEMDCGVVQADGPERTGSPSCEQRDAGREGEGDPGSRRPVALGKPRIRLPQRSDMICGFASLKGQRLSECSRMPSFRPLNNTLLP